MGARREFHDRCSPIRDIAGYCSYRSGKLICGIAELLSSHGVNAARVGYPVQCFLQQADRIFDPAKHLGIERGFPHEVATAIPQR
jgi:hypothetical protein